MKACICRGNNINCPDCYGSGFIYEESRGASISPKKNQQPLILERADNVLKNVSKDKRSYAEMMGKRRKKKKGKHVEKLWTLDQLIQKAKNELREINRKISRKQGNSKKQHKKSKRKRFTSKSSQSNNKRYSSPPKQSIFPISELLRKEK